MIAMDECRHDTIVHLATAMRQLRAYHMDTHYALALFRYEKEFAVKFRDITNLVFLDDKHRCKVGEPGFPVAAVEREKRL